MNAKTLLNKKQFCLLMAAGAASALLTGCSGSSGSAPETSTEKSAIVDYTCFSNPESAKKIYVILKNYHGDYWKKVIAGISEAAEEIDAAIYLGGIDNETDIDGQISLIEQAVKQNADGILLAPANSFSLVDSCHAVKEQQIPLVLIDSSINSDDYSHCYMTNNMSAGETAAQEMLSLLQDAGNSATDHLEVGIMPSLDTFQTMVNRISGFLDYWSNYAPQQWNIAEDIYLNGGNVSKAQSDASRLLKKHEDLKGIFGCSNTSTTGIVNVLTEQERTDVVMVGFDLADETRQFIQNPDFYGASLMQKQDEMGYQGILSLNDLIDGKESGQKYFDTGIILIDENYLMENSVS